MRLRAGALMITLCLLLSACGGGGTGGGPEQRALEIRGDYLSMSSCGGSAEVTADYGQRVYDFGMTFTWARDGELVITVTAPEEAAGVTARLAEGETALEYDGVRLETGPLDPSGLSPVDAIPALLTAAREGFIAECGTETLGETEAIRLCCRDPDGQPGSGQEIQLWLDPAGGALLRGEISVDGFTVIQCTFTGFAMELPAEDTITD